MAEIIVDKTAFNLVENTIITPNDWIIQVAPDHIGFFAKITKQIKDFKIDDEEILDASSKQRSILTTKGNLNYRYRFEEHHSRKSATQSLKKQLFQYQCLRSEKFGS